MSVIAARAPVNPGQLAFDLEALKGHLRVSGSSEDAAITNIGLTAEMELERFAQVALLYQQITVRYLELRLTRQVLTMPIGPYASEGPPIVTVDGEAFTSFDYIPGPRPALRLLLNPLDFTPDEMVVEYQAGFGATADDVPADLRQALMDQAALHYDGRSPMDAKALTTSPHMARIGAKYRGVRL